MKITAIEIGKIAIPLKTPFITALRRVDVAGVACMMGCMLESKVGIIAAAALSAGKAVITKNDLDAADLMAADPVRGGITYDKDHLVVPDAPGLGITAIDGWLPLKD